MKDKCLEHFLWNCSQVNATRPPLWLVNIGSCNGLVPSRTKVLNSVKPYIISSKPQWVKTVSTWTSDFIWLHMLWSSLAQNLELVANTLPKHFGRICRQHFLFFVWKLLYFDQDFTKICCQGSNEHEARIGWDNGLALNGQQATLYKTITAEFTDIYMHHVALMSMMSYCPLCGEVMSETVLLSSQSI